jgi:hypothetical protein
LCVSFRRVAVIVTCITLFRFAPTIAFEMYRWR